MRLFWFIVLIISTVIGIGMFNALYTMAGGMR